ncbi:PXA domain-containing protein [Radiomyces spectabilis]|uniref:PXA domain-containing protein n=1 Tax=Radiomyces spectabilis TaxID=64574 RepID=UPI00221E91F8|nr:PXA domain-containing protein [Radiomyces spectabilis]KAI8369312.1 PXA domain-containing protein [Radiomyces spectabilis]
MPSVLMSDAGGLKAVKYSAVGLLVLMGGLRWPYAVHALLRIAQWAAASICALFVLNLIVLYIYIKYFVSPANESQDRRKYRQVEEFRPLRFVHKSIWPQVQEQRRKDNTREKPAHVFATAAESEAFEELLTYVLRDFIDSWFVHISRSTSEVSFPKSVDHIIRSAAIALKKRVEETDLLTVIVSRIIPKVTSHVSEFRAAETALRGKSLERSVTQSDELDLLLASQFRGGKLHSALTTAAVTTKPTEVAYLRHLVERVLPFVIDEKEMQSGPVRVIIREMVTCAVLQPVVDMVADPDFWNCTIDSYLGKALREQKMVRKLREVLNRHSNAMDATMDPEMPTTATDPLDDETLVPHDTFKPSKRSSFRKQFSLTFLGAVKETDNDTGLDPRKQHEFGSSRMGRRAFHEFLKMIDEEKNLLDLKRVRNDIVTQIRKKKAQIGDRDPEEVIDGEKVEDVTVYVNRLSVAKKRVDKRIAFLSGEKEEVRTSSSHLFRNRKQSTSIATPTSGFTLEEILRNTAGLSYFMEFMDRRHDMFKLQFWLIVEGFRSSPVSNVYEQRRDDRTFLQDVKMVYDMYLSSTTPHRLPVMEPLVNELHQAIRHAEGIEVSSDTDASFSAEVQQIREKLYQIQQHVFWQIEKEHFPYFKRSDLYFKYLASSPNPATEPVLERRSLDETTWYRRTPSVHSETDVAKNRPTSASMERTASDHLPQNDTWDKPDIAKAESDTEVLSRDPRRNQTTYITFPRSLNAGSAEFSRRRGHVRAASDNNYAFSRFLSLSKVLGSANDWWNMMDGQGGRTSRPASINETAKKRNSTHGSIKSTDTEYPETDYEDDGTTTKSMPIIAEPDRALLSEPTTALASESSFVPSPMARQQLARRNTVDAVEAELQSIIDDDKGGIDVLHEEDDDSQKSEEHPSSSKVEPSTSSSSTTANRQRPRSLLLSGAHNVKSSMALPVSSVDTLPQWTSSGGINTISIIEHSEFNDHAAKKSDQTAISGPDSPSTSIAPEKTAEETTNVHLAPPGDLMLADKVAKLTEEMEKLIQQEAIVDALIQKAESKNKVEELRILKKSKSMFRRELQQIKYQRSQYELQESENVLMPDRTTVSITSSTIGSDDHGDFALYVIEIQQLGFDGNYASGWIVARRYSEFFALHQKLKTRYPAVKLLEFPSKWPLLKLQKSFVEARRVNLERYLRRLLEDKEICKSEELRIFLSQQNIFVPGPDQSVYSMNPENSARPSSKKKKSAMLTDRGTADASLAMHSSCSSSTVASTQSRSMVNLQRSIAADAMSDAALHRKPSKGFMKHIYKTVAEGIDDMFIGPSMLDLITQRLGEQLMDFSNDTTTTTTDVLNDSPSPKPVRSAPSSSNSSNKMMVGNEFAPDVPVEFSTESLKNIDPEGVTRLTEPLCDLFIEMFELKEKNNWLRRQAVVIILQQILGGTIERKLRELIRYLGTEPMMVFYLRRIIDSLWPGGASITFKPARQPEEKAQTREEANRKLSAWLPGRISR